MLQTYEAVLQPDLVLHFIDGAPPELKDQRKVLVTLLTEPSEPVQAASVPLVLQRARTLRAVFPQDLIAQARREMSASRDELDRGAR